MTEPRPTVVTLCGSTRFRPDFDRVMSQLTMAGHIVIGPGVWWAEESSGYTPAMAAAVKEALDEIHLRKIDLADVVFVVNRGGYVGESTRREVEYATKTGKQVVYMVPLGVGEWQTPVPAACCVEFARTGSAHTEVCCDIATDPRDD